MKFNWIPSDKKGQAVIEYTLMLIVSVSLIILFVAQVFEPFGRFLDAYMGSYVSCLLDMGELPTLGGDNSPLSGESDCNVRFQSFSIKAGRPPAKGNQTGRDRDSNSSNDPTNLNKNKGSGGSSDGESSSMDENSSSKKGSGARYVGGGGPNSNNFLNGPRSAEAGSLENKKVTEIDISGVSGMGQLRSKFFSSNDRKNDKTKTIDLSSMNEEDRKKLFSPTSAGRIISSSEIQKPIKKTLVQRQNLKNETSNNNDDESFTIGNFLRLLIIIGIIIAILVFVGGQLLQISKSE